MVAFTWKFSEKRFVLDMVKRLEMNKPMKEGVEMQYYSTFIFSEGN
jgi:hypothetical protein